MITILITITIFIKQHENLNHHMCDEVYALTTMCVVCVLYLHCLLCTIYICVWISSVTYLSSGGMSLPGISGGESQEIHHLLHSPDKEGTKKENTTTSAQHHHQSAKNTDVDSKHHRASRLSSPPRRSFDGGSQIDCRLMSNAETTAESKHHHNCPKPHHVPRHLEIQADISSHKYDHSVIVSEEGGSSLPQSPVSSPPSRKSFDRSFSTGSANRTQSHPPVHVPPIAKTSESLSEEALPQSHHSRGHHVPRHLEVQADLASHKYDHSVLAANKDTESSERGGAVVVGPISSTAAEAKTSHGHPLPPLSHCHSAESSPDKDKQQGPREAAYQHLLTASQDTIAAEHAHRGAVAPLVQDQRQPHTPPKRAGRERHVERVTASADSKDSAERDVRGGDEKRGHHGGHFVTTKCIEEAGAGSQQQEAKSSGGGVKSIHAGESSAFKERGHSNSLITAVTALNRQAK
jgi:hypothetical protein